jgi:hypothetical protein
MYRTTRTHDEVVNLSTDRIVQGFADARMLDGTSCRVARLDNGTWQAYLRGAAIESPKGTWELAAGDLALHLAAERKHLRFASGY